MACNKRRGVGGGFDGRALPLFFSADRSDFRPSLARALTVAKSASSVCFCDTLASIRQPDLSLMRRGDPLRVVGVISRARGAGQVKRCRGDVPAISVALVASVHVSFCLVTSTPGNGRLFPNFPIANIAMVNGIVSGCVWGLSSIAL